MKQWLLAAIGALAMGPAAFAQGEELDLSPAPGLAQFDRTLGHWRASGKVYMAEGAEGLAWTSTQHVQRILNGHAIQEDSRIEMGPGMPALHFRGFTGWDRAADRPVSYSMSNAGQGGRSELRWIDADTLVVTTSYVEAGVPLCERAVIHHGDGSYTIRVDQAKGAAPFRLYVEGSAEKVADAGEGFAALPGGFFSPTGEAPPGVAKLAPLAGMTGRYTLKGKVQAVPGLPDMEITGTEEVAFIYGGNVLTYHGTGGEGGPFVWEGFGYQWWDPERGCHVMLHLDNMGGIGTAEVHVVDGRHLVSTSARMYVGQPMAERSIISLDDEGRIAKVSSHAILGTSAPTQTFAGVYTRVGEAGASAAEAAPSGEGAQQASRSFTPGSCCDKAAQAGKSCPHPCCVKAAQAGTVCAACN